MVCAALPRLRFGDAAGLARAVSEAGVHEEVAAIQTEDRDVLLDESEDFEARAKAIAVGDRGLLQRHRKLLADIEEQRTQVAQKEAAIAALEARLFVSPAAHTTFLLPL